MGEIVVTAQFRAQNLQDTPLSITAVNAAMLEARNQTEMTDVASRAPSVGITSGGQGAGTQATTVTIRGIGQVDFNLAVEPGVGIYIDDVYYGLALGSAFDLVDLDRVEILRGPQGTLSGKNSIGGSIKLYSRKPGDDPDAYVSAEYGSFNRVGVKAASNFTIVPDKLYLRLTGLARHTDGYFDRLDYTCATGRAAPGGVFSTDPTSCKIGEEGGQDLYAVRGALRWIIAPGIEDNLIGDFTKNNSTGSPTKVLSQRTFPSGNSYITGPESYTSYANLSGHLGTDRQYTASSVDPLTSWGFSNDLDVKLSDTISLKSITGYRRAKGRQTWHMGTAEPVFLVNNGFTHKQFSQELRLSAKLNDMFDLTVGGYYYKANSSQSGRFNLEFVGSEFAINDPVTSESKSGFAQLIIAPMSRLNVTTGIRYTDESKSYLFRRFEAEPGVPIDAASQALNGSRKSFQGSRWDYRVAVDYEIADNIRPYVQYSTGFKGGGVNPRVFFPSQAVSFGQEIVKAYEAGVKSTLFDRRMRLNAAYYHTDYSNLQASLRRCDSISPFPGAPCAATQNVGDAKIDGFEVETEIRPVRGLLIDGSLSYTNFQYTSVIAATRISLNSEPQLSPKWKYAIGAQYEVDMGGLGSLTPRLDWSWQSSMESSAINTASSSDPGYVKSYGLLDASLTYRTSDGNWQLSLNAKNLADKFYYVNKYEASDGQTVTGQPGRPREIFVTLKRNF